jgi:hypothetical protein
VDSSGVLVQGIVECLILEEADFDKLPDRVKVGAPTQTLNVSPALSLLVIGWPLRERFTGPGTTSRYLQPL